MKDISVFLRTNDVCLDGSKAWCSDLNLGAICKVDLDTFDSEVHCYLNDVNSNSHFQHRNIFMEAGKLYLIPLVFDGICVYDISSKSNENIHAYKNEECISNLQISKAFLINKKIYIFPVEMEKDLIIFDIESQEFSYSAEICNEIKKYSSIITYDSLDVMDDVIWIIPYSSSQIIEYKTDDGSICTYDLGESGWYSVKAGMHLCVGRYCTSDVWLFDVKMKAVISKIKASSELNNLLVYKFFVPIYHNNKIFYLSKDRGNTLIEQDGFYKIPLGKYISKLSDNPCECFVEYNNKLILFPSDFRYLVKLDLKSWEIEVVEWHYNISEQEYNHSKTSTRNFYYERLLSGNILQEGEAIKLEDYIQML